MASFPSSGRRRGKWTAEEEAYATRVILAFKDGLLDVARGTSLRSYLSDKLNCAPMRISKKFSGDASIRRSAFHPREDASPATIERSRREIAELEEAWRRKLGILPGSSHTMSSAAGHRKRARADSDDSDEEEEEDDDDKVGETEKEEEDPRHPLISEDMAAVVGVSRANHWRLVKLLWKYIKAHDLQNPSNKNEILCDAKLQKVFKKNKVTSFGMSKLLGAHIFKEAAAAAEAERRRAARDMPSMSLIDACDKGRTDIVQAWLDKGADVDRAENDWTPLQSACFNGHVDAARLLLDKGAEVDLADEGGMTPLFIACQEGHVDAARLMLEKGAEVDRAAKNGTTPLYMASLGGHADVARLLRDCGADVDRANKKLEENKKNCPYAKINFYVEIHHRTKDGWEGDRESFASIGPPKCSAKLSFKTPRKWYDIPFFYCSRANPHPKDSYFIEFGFEYKMKNDKTLTALGLNYEVRGHGHDPYWTYRRHDHIEEHDYTTIDLEEAWRALPRWNEEDCVRRRWSPERATIEKNGDSIEVGDHPCVRYELRRKPREKKSSKQDTSDSEDEEEDDYQIRFTEATLLQMQDVLRCSLRLEEYTEEFA